MKILFLDFDGVINPLLKSLGSDNFSSVACNHVANMLVKEPTLRVVVSSAWRQWGLDRIREILQKNGIDPTKVIGLTEHKGGWEPNNRHKQIRDWLKEHPEIKDYVVLDDYPLEGLEHRQVKMNGYIGFTQTDMERALSILAGTSEPA